MRRALALVCTLATPATAEVVAADTSAMEVRLTTTVAAPPARVWATLIAPRRWWDAAHSWSGSPANFSLDARPGGCLCEALPGGGVEHLHVVFAQPGRLLRLTGALGPFQSEAVTGVMDWTLAPAAGGTTLTLSYKLSGHRGGGFAPVAPLVDGMLAGQLARLRAAAARP